MATNKEPLRFLMVGMTGVGKSATGNSILGFMKLKGAEAWTKLTKPFFSKNSPESVTINGKMDEAVVNGRKIALVDTPGFFDTKFSLEKIVAEVQQCMLMVSPGPHAILLVTKADQRHTGEVKEALKTMTNVLGPGVDRYLIVLFTGLDSILRDDEDIDDYVENLRGPYKEIIHRANNRYVAFDNTCKPTSPENGERVKQLVAMTDKMVQENGGSCYQSGILQQSFQLMQERERWEEERKKYLEEQKNRESLMQEQLEELKKLREMTRTERATVVAASEEARRHRDEVRERTTKSGKCFASSSIVRVQLPDGQIRTKRLHDLEAGDLVESYDSSTKTPTFSPVYYITYKDDDQTDGDLRRFYYRNSDGEEKSVALHPKHMLYANASSQESIPQSNNSPPLSPTMAEDVFVGDTLWTYGSGGQLCPTTVVKVDYDSAAVRHPLTLTHHIIVDGILCSVHTHNEWLARAITTPLRLLFKVSPRFGDLWMIKKMVHSWSWVEDYFLE